MADQTSKVTSVLSTKDILALALDTMIGWGRVILAGSRGPKVGSLGAMVVFALGGALLLWAKLVSSKVPLSESFEQEPIPELG